MERISADGHRRAQENGEGLAPLADVGGEEALALEQGRVLDAKPACAFHFSVSRSGVF